MKIVKTNYFNHRIIQTVPSFSGIYWLFESKCDFLKLIYIGKTCDIHRRLREHSKRFRFDVFTYKCYPEYKLEEIEKKLLSDYFYRFGRLPEFNRQLG